MEFPMLQQSSEPTIQQSNNPAIQRSITPSHDANVDRTSPHSTVRADFGNNGSRLGAALAAVGTASHAR